MSVFIRPRERSSTVWQRGIWEYLTDITDTKKMETQMRTAHEKLQQKYQEEMMYRDAVSGEILTTSRLNLTKRVVEDMWVGTKTVMRKCMRRSRIFVPECMHMQKSIPDRGTESETVTGWNA